jgi:hypothetical protein
MPMSSASKARTNFSGCEFRRKDVEVAIIGKDKQLFLDHVDWAKSAVEYAILKGTPTTAEFCANAWKTMGPGSPMPLLERIAQ